MFYTSTYIFCAAVLLVLEVPGEREVPGVPRHVDGGAAVWHFTYIYIYIYIYLYIHTITNTCMCIYIYIYIHTHICIRSLATSMGVRPSGGPGEFTTDV